MSTGPRFANASEALEMVRAGLRFLAAVDPTELASETQARCLLTLEQLDSMSTAARASILGAFTAGQGYSADADYSPRSWLIHRTRVTKGAARGHLGWARRAAAHPEVAAALAAGDVLSESYARTICGWTDRLPQDCRGAADAILVAAARAGADLEDLARLAAEIYARSRPGVPEEGPDNGFDDRSVKLETTFDGAGVLSGNLTPECSAVVSAVLDALSAPMGAEDTRTHEQRCHDALEDAMRRLVAGGLLPERAGQPVRMWAHISLADLLALDGSSALQHEWADRVRGQWAAHRAAASVAGGDGGAWLDGDAARAAACDAVMTPVVTGEVDPGVLDDLVQLCVELAGHGQCAGPDPAGPDHDRPALDQAGQPGGPDDDPAPDDVGCGSRGQDHDSAPDRVGHRQAGPAPLTAHARELLERAIIGKAVDLVSGPGGLASFLRRQQLGARLAGPSLPLDIGYSDNVPTGIRNAVILRDRHCQWTGGCHQPASACQVHHVKHKAHGGPTSVKDCILLCFFHHQVVIHRWGWTLVLNPDGTTTAWNPDRTKVLHSHGPPAKAG